jgi:hypothetical protein
LIRSAVANPVQGASRASRQGQRAAKGREIVRRDYPDRDHPKLLEHVVDQPANAAATAVRKSPAGSGAVSLPIHPCGRPLRNLQQILQMSFVS